MAQQPKKGGIETAKDARELTGEIADQSVEFGKPAFVTQNPRGEAKDMLRNFHFNYPFCGVQPSPRLARLIGTGADIPTAIDLPDGTIWVSLQCPRGVDTVFCFDGIPPTFASLTPGVPGIGILNPADDVGFLVYGMRSIGLITRTAALVSIVPYISTDAAGVKNK